MNKRARDDSQNAEEEDCELMKLSNGGKKVLCGTSRWSDAHGDIKCRDLLVNHALGDNLFTTGFEVDVISKINCSVSKVVNDLECKDDEICITEEAYLEAKNNDKSDIICFFTLADNPSLSFRWRLNLRGFVLKSDGAIFNSECFRGPIPGSNGSQERGYYLTRVDRIKGLKEVMSDPLGCVSKSEPSYTKARENEVMKEHQFSSPIDLDKIPTGSSLWDFVFANETFDFEKLVQPHEDAKYLETMLNDINVQDWVYSKIFFYTQLASAQDWGSVIIQVLDYDDQQFEMLKPKLSRISNNVKDWFQGIQALTFLATCSLSKSMIRFVQFCEMAVQMVKKNKVPADEGRDWKLGVKPEELGEIEREYIELLGEFMSLAGGILESKDLPTALEPVQFIYKQTKSNISYSLGDVNKVYENLVLDEKNNYKRIIDEDTKELEDAL